MSEHSLIVLSDLHLSAVQSPLDGTCAAREGFHYDDAFSHFVDALLTPTQRKRAEHELLLLGDFLDFLHTKVPLTQSSLLETTEAASLQKIAAITRAHPSFFEALKRFAATGSRINIVPGNHDMDLMRPAVQQFFVKSIWTDSQATVHFYPWMYHVPGLLYAEHGHQYHDISAYTTLLTPFRRGDENELELPVGASSELYLYRLIERLRPPAENIHSPIRYLVTSYLKQPNQLLAAMPDVFRAFGAAFRQLAYRSSRRCKTRRQHYQKNVLPAYAASAGFSLASCVALDQLAEVDNGRMLKRLLCALLSNNKSDPVRNGYLYPKARMISQTLHQEKREVTFYCFGHSHRPAKVQLADQGREFYLNAGSWSAPAYPGAPGDRTRFPFVEIHWGNGQPATASMMEWDEARQKPGELGEP